MWLYFLPDEILEKIYKEVFKKCLNEINNLNYCNSCERYHLIIKKRCILCKSMICNSCWNTYLLKYELQVFNYYKYKPYPFFNCKNC